MIFMRASVHQHRYDIHITKSEAEYLLDNSLEGSLSVLGVNSAKDNTQTKLKLTFEYLGIDRGAEVDFGPKGTDYNNASKVTIRISCGLLTSIQNGGALEVELHNRQGTVYFHPEVQQNMVFYRWLGNS